MWYANQVRTSLGHAALALAAMILATSAVARATPPSPMRKGPYLQELGPSSVVVRVEVDPPAPADLEVSADTGDAGGATPVVVHDGASAAFHSLHVDKLKPATRYRYRVKVSGASSPEGTFTTAPAPDSGAPFTFLAYGDNRSGDEAHAAIVRLLTAAPGDFVVQTGDLVVDGSDASQWQTFFDIEAPLIRDRCVFACVGNHELVERGGVSFLRYFGRDDIPASDDPGRPLYYSFRWSNARFFVLNGMDEWSTSAEKEWLRAELTRADSEPGLAWRFVVLHAGPWSSGPHGNNTRMIAAGIPALLTQHKVDLVMSGHDHIYERGENDGLRYVITGGGGAPLYKIERIIPSTRKAEPAYHYLRLDVGPDAVNIVVTRVDGSILERARFKRGTTSWDGDPVSAAAVAIPPQDKPEGLSPGPSPVGPAVTGGRCGCDVAGAGPSGGLMGLAFVALALARRAPRRPGRARGR
jgi:hypothetical protein